MNAAQELDRLNDQLSKHMAIIQRCTTDSPQYGRILLASTPDARYPYVYPRDAACAVQLLRRLASSKRQYDVAGDAFTLMKSLAHFMKDVITDDGHWGQRYNLHGEDKSIYKQEDNNAHGIAIICNYLLSAYIRQEKVANLDEFLGAVETALEYAHEHHYHTELNLFESTTAIHESAMEEGFTCWVNFAYLYALSLANEVADIHSDHPAVFKRHFAQRQQFLHSVNELFTVEGRYARRIDPAGQLDYRPDFTLLSPFYFGFRHYARRLEASVEFLEKHLWDPELGMIMRYLPFTKDFATHVHAGNGPWLQYTAILAQYHYWSGNTQRGDQLLASIDRHANDRGEIPEHLSTCNRFDFFIEKEWQTGTDFAKEFDKHILLDNLSFDHILEEANNMSRSYQRVASNAIFRDPSKREGGYIQFSTPLTWSHIEYARALLVRAKDWWRMYE
jgi:GH15 family glucan-1,4-alpha-glucosidase